MADSPPDHDKEEAPKDLPRTPIQLLNNFFFAIVLLAIGIGALVWGLSR